MTQRVALQPGYILHHRLYRNSSLLLEVFSREFGRVGLVARGARGKRSRFGGLLQPFRPLLLSWCAKGELGTLTAAEADGIALEGKGPALISGFYLNELLIRLVGRNDPQRELYHHYAAALHRLALGERSEGVLRRFEVELLQQLGYGLILDHDAASGEPIDPRRRYRYSLDRGPLVEGTPECDELDLPIHGRTLLELASGTLEEGSLTEAKRLMRAALAPHLGGRPLKSRELFVAMYGNRGPVPASGTGLDLSYYDGIHDGKRHSSRCEHRSCGDPASGAGDPLSRPDSGGDPGRAGGGRRHYPPPARGPAPHPGAGCDDAARHPADTDESGDGGDR